MSSVSLVRCESYDRERCYHAIARAVDLLGGMERFVSSGQRVLVKPNILHASEPDKAVVTHPDVVYAVCRLLKESGCEVLIAESPGAGSIYSPSGLRRAYETVGYAEVASDLGIELNYDVEYDEVPNPQGMKIKRFLIMRPALHVDAVVSISKLKTHLFTYLTGGTKNLFGLVPGLEKATFHGRLPEPDDFGRMLVDLNELIKPKLQVMDAVVGMEGDGPYSGRPRQIGAVLVSQSYAAIDVVASRLINMHPEDICTVRAAWERGVLEKDLGTIEVLGDDLDPLVVKDFKRPSTYAAGKRKRAGAIERNLVKMVRVYALRPAVMHSHCSNCGRCVRACPTGAMRESRGKVLLSHKRCIRCYTCHEMCTSNAISLKRSLGGRAVALAVERKNLPEGR
jgi:uncharacterized protein (DUF362 family)/NAD-dependent dihydropyrimidine dehydrogenase PreA subunit